MYKYEKYATFPELLGLWHQNYETKQFVANRVYRFALLILTFLFMGGVIYSEILIQQRQSVLLFTVLVVSGIGMLYQIFMPQEKNILLSWMAKDTVKIFKLANAYHLPYKASFYQQFLSTEKIEKIQKLSALKSALELYMEMELFNIDLFNHAISIVKSMTDDESKYDSIDMLKIISLLMRYAEMSPAPSTNISQVGLLYFPMSKQISEIGRLIDQARHHL